MLAIALGASLILGGCASGAGGRSDAQGIATLAGRPARAELSRLATNESVRISGQTPASAADGDADASRTLDAVLAEIGSKPAPAWFTPPAKTPEPDSSARTRAQLLYVAGRASLTAGDFEKAITQLQSAAALDPGSATLWMALGEAQRSASRRLASLTSLQKAAALGSSSARLFWLLAQEAERAGEDQEQLWLLARARGLQPEREDDALAFLIDAELGLALAKAGFIRAADEATALSLRVPEEFPDGTRYRDEALAMLRRRGEGWLQIAERAVERGDLQTAERSLAEAEALASTDRQTLLAQQVGVALRGGRPAQAALKILDAIEADNGQSSAKTVDLIRTSIAGTSAAEPLGRALEELELTLASSDRRDVSEALIRAQIAAWPDGVARRLRARLAAGDDAALGSWLDLAPAGDGDVRTKVVLELVRQNPASTRQVADVLVDRGVGVFDALRRLESRRQTEARLLRAEVLLRLGCAAEASEVAASLGDAAATLLPRLEVQARSAAAAGRWADYELLDVRLEGQVREMSVPARLALARARVAAQRFDAAWDIVSPLADGSVSESDPDLLYSVGQIALRAQQIDAAESLFKALVERSPADERGYEGLLGVLALRNPDDVDALAAIVRQMRQNIGSGRLLRWLAAQEQTARGQGIAARTTLIELTRDEPNSGQLIEVLVATVPQDATPESARDIEDRLKQILSERPDAISPRIGLAQVLARTGRAEEALSLLDIPMTPVPPDVLRARTLALRAAGRTGDARQVAEERLTREPRSIDEGVEYAALLSESGRYAAAARDLERDIPRQSTLTGAQKRVILSIIAGGLSQTGLKPDDISGLLDLASWAGERGTPMTPPMHDQLVQLLAKADGVTAELTRRAADLTRSQLVSIGDAAYQRVAQVLVNERRAEVAAVMLVGVLRDRADLPVEFVIQTLQVVRTAGSAGIVDALLDVLRQPGRAPALLRRLNMAVEGGESDDVAFGELSYQLGDAFAQDGRDDLAEVAYRRTLQVDPNHPWANNNVGYYLVERGERLDEAEGMLLRAVKKLGDDGNVLDSLGWLRYRRGQIADTAGPGGTPIEGALTIMRRAAATEKGRESPVIQDHLGDTLWRAGDQAGAKAAWSNARQLARLFQQARGLPPGQVEYYRNVYQRSDAKLQSLTRGEQPSIAEFLSELQGPTPERGEAGLGATAPRP